MKQILYKDNCDDLFKNAIVDEDKGLRMFPKKTQAQFLDMKIKKIKKMLIFKKIGLVI